MFYIMLIICRRYSKIFFYCTQNLKDIEKIIIIAITKIKTYHTNTYRSHQSRNITNFRNISK